MHICIYIHIYCIYYIYAATTVKAHNVRGANHVRYIRNIKRSRNEAPSESAVMSLASKDHCSEKKRINAGMIAIGCVKFALSSSNLMTITRVNCH